MAGLFKPDKALAATGSVANALYCTNICVDCARLCKSCLFLVVPPGTGECEVVESRGKMEMALGEVPERRLVLNRGEEAGKAFI